MSTQNQAYPLAWPPAYPRTLSRKNSLFGEITFAQAKTALLAELKRMGATEIVLSTNIPLRADGQPYSDYQRRTITDPGVAIYFKWKGSNKSMAVDRWLTIEDNLHALELSIAAMRGLERWGVSSILERAFTGFTALPAPPQWWDTLGVNQGAPLAICEAAYRAKMKDAHPDAGGSETMAANLNWAISRAREEARAA